MIFLDSIKLLSCVTPVLHVDGPPAAGLQISRCNAVREPGRAGTSVRAPKELLATLTFGGAASGFPLTSVLIPGRPWTQPSVSSRVSLPSLDVTVSQRLVAGDPGVLRIFQGFQHGQSPYLCPPRPGAQSRRGPRRPGRLRDPSGRRDGPGLRRLAAQM